MGRPASYPAELRQRAVRLVQETRSEYPSEFEAIRSVATKLGIGSPETVRKWVRRAEIDAGQRPGMTSEEHAEVKRLRREVAELRRANEILKAAAAFVKHHGPFAAVARSTGPSASRRRSTSQTGDSPSR